MLLRFLNYVCFGPGGLCVPPMVVLQAKVAIVHTDFLPSVLILIQAKGIYKNFFPYFVLFDWYTLYRRYLKMCLIMACCLLWKVNSYNASMCISNVHIAWFPKMCTANVLGFTTDQTKNGLTKLSSEISE